MRHDGDLDQLAQLVPADRDKLGEVAARIRRAIERAAVPENLEEAIRSAVIDWGEDVAFSVRSSATVEDLPSMSFAGLHDTYLNLVGVNAVLEHVHRCWASLFTERAVMYRARNGIDHHQVAMAVVIQQMVQPRASGVLFTTDPVYKQALMGEAARLVEAGVLGEKEDIFYLRFDELHDAVRADHVDRQLVRQRRDAFRSYQALTPPRVLTSDGEAVIGRFRRNDPPSGALPGLGVSSGFIEGRARWSSTSPMPTSSPATSSSPPTPTPAGRRCSFPSRAWSPRSAA